MATLGEFLSPEAGQERRKWLNETLGYYLPPELRGIVGLGAELNPVTNMERAGTAAQRVADPSLGGWDRMAAAGDMAVNMGAVLAPVAGAKLAGTAGVDGANAIVEALTAASPMKGAVDDFLVDEFGGVGFRAYHGSPHDFDRFSLDKIGTGEGAQAYGHGLYFADSEDVARSYRDTLSQSGTDGAQRRLQRAGGDIDAAIAQARAKADAYRVGGAEQYATAVEEDLRFLEKFKATGEWPSGRMYEVQINADPNDFLDWDKPLSEQPKNVREWFDSRGITPGFAGNQSGAELMMAERSLLGPEGTMVAMRDANVPGIKYLDHGSRFNAMDGIAPPTQTRNYVVFDDNLIEILRKYGLAGAVPLGAVLGQPQDPMGSYLEAQ